MVNKNRYGIIWLKIDDKLLNSNIPAYICHVYIPPRMSNVLDNDVDLFEWIETDNTNYCNQGTVYICGDTNSHTSDLIDFLNIDRN